MPKGEDGFVDSLNVASVPHAATSAHSQAPSLMASGVMSV
jgi:hypothetical protein